jgi:hypothetical protein
LAVERYPVDIEAEQVVLWLLDEARLNGSGLLVSATRAYQRQDLDQDRNAGIGDVEREDLGENAEVGVLEVVPRHKPSLWTLRIRVADDIGPALPDDEPMPDGEEEIDLATFYEEFIRADRGLAEVSAEVDGSSAKGSLTRVLDAMIEDRHKA